MAGPAPDRGARRGGGEKSGHGEGAGTRAPEEAVDRYYKIGEVCAMTDTQPYVLRFWESEFPQLAPQKSRAGQRLYQKRDVDLVVRIRKLLYDEEYTIAGARKKLEELGFGGPDTGESAPKPAVGSPGRAKSSHPERPLCGSASRVSFCQRTRSSIYTAIKETYSGRTPGVGFMTTASSGRIQCVAPV